MAEETNHNEAGEVAPSTVDKQAPSVSEEHAPSTDSPVATDIPSANAPDPKAASSEANPNAAVETETAKKPAAAKKPGAKAEGDATPAKAAKKEKAPALEDKPFAEFVQQHYLPALKEALAKQNVSNLQLSLEKQKIPIIGYAQQPECWQIIGSWDRGMRQFRVYFTQEDIQGTRGFSFAENGGKPSTLEPFLCDERKITLDLLVFGVVQRLNAQKWLVRN